MVIKRRKIAVLLAVIILGSMQGIKASIVTNEQDPNENCEMGHTVIISTETDFMGVSTYPIIMQIDKPITVRIMPVPVQAGDVLRIEGEKGKVLGELSLTLGISEYTFDAKQILNQGPIKIEGGIYWLTLTNRDTNKVQLKRKLYLNGENESQGYQMSDLKLHNGKEGLSVGFSLLNNYGGVDAHDKTQGQAAFAIGEIGGWVKTIKKMNTTEKWMEILENKDFILNSGKYQIFAAVKSPYSIEAEDYKSATYYKSYADQQDKEKEHKMSVQIEEITGIKDKNRKFKAAVKCTDCQNLIVDFLIKDDLGIKEVKSIDTSTDSNLTFERERKDFDYELIVRARHKSPMYPVEGITLPASYEAEKRILVKKEMSRKSTIQISSISITPSSIEKYYEMKDNENMKSTNTQYGLEDEQVVKINGKKAGEEAAKVNVNNKNYITIHAEDQAADGGTLMYYKAWAVDDHVLVTLGDYSTNPQFVYYPKSGESDSSIIPDEARIHKLYVAAQSRGKDGQIVGQDIVSVTLQVNNG